MSMLHNVVTFKLFRYKKNVPSMKNITEIKAQNLMLFEKIKQLYKEYQI